MATKTSRLKNAKKTPSQIFFVIMSMVPEKMVSEKKSN